MILMKGEARREVGNSDSERRSGQIAPQKFAERLRCVDAGLCKGNCWVKTGVRKNRIT